MNLKTMNGLPWHGLPAREGGTDISVCANTHQSSTMRILAQAGMPVLPSLKPTGWQPVPRNPQARFSI